MNEVMTDNYIKVQQAKAKAQSSQSLYRTSQNRSDFSAMLRSADRNAAVREQDASDRAADARAAKAAYSSRSNGSDDSYDANRIADRTDSRNNGQVNRTQDRSRAGKADDARAASKSAGDVKDVEEEGPGEGQQQTAEDSAKLVLLIGNVQGENNAVSGLHAAGAGTDGSDGTGADARMNGISGGDALADALSSVVNGKDASEAAAVNELLAGAEKGGLLADGVITAAELSATAGNAAAGIGAAGTAGTGGDAAADGARVLEEAVSDAKDAAAELADVRADLAGDAVRLSDGQLADAQEAAALRGDLADQAAEAAKLRSDLQADAADAAGRLASAGDADGSLTGGAASGNAVTAAGQANGANGNGEAGSGLFGANASAGKGTNGALVSGDGLGEENSGRADRADRIGAGSQEVHAQAAANLTDPSVRNLRFAETEGSLRTGSENGVLRTSETSLAEDLGKLLASKMPLKSGTLELELYPANLGRITIQVSYMTGRAAVSIAASNPSTLQLLTQNAGEMGSILKQTTGQETTVIVPQETGAANAQTASDSESANKQTAQEQQEHVEQYENAMRQKDSADFLQKMRLQLV